MTTQEFSNEFDVLYNNIMSNQAPGLNEYEKSVFLTKAQDEIVKNYFNAKSNAKQEGFDDSIKRQSDFSQLLMTSKADPFEDSSIVKNHPNSKVFKIDNTNILFIINESLTIGNIIYPVIPVTRINFTELLLKPFKYPPKNQVWRLFNNVEINSTDTDNVNKELISELLYYNSNAIGEYVIRYVKRPNPIILIDLEDNYGGVTINGMSTVSECELHESVHSEILQRAVELAKAAYIGNVETIVQLGNRSE